MKKFKITIIVLFALTAGFLAIRCQHEDSTITVEGPDAPSHGTEIITCTNCNTAPATGWYHDKAHSNVMWETQYKTLGSLLTGRFDSFFMNSLTWDEGVPANIAFDGYVWLNSVNTSEPGRDDGCLLTSFGTANGLTDEAQNKATLVSIPGSGRYSTTDAGFLVNANFTFKGITKEVTVKMFYAKQYPDPAKNTAGLQSTFEIRKADFLPNDSNIGDIVRIQMNNTLKKK